MWCISLLVLDVACSKAAFQTLRDRREKTMLAASASDYWLAMQWGDYAKASAFHPDKDARTSLTRQLADGVWRVSDADLLSIEIDPMPEAPAPDWVRGGSVLVRLEVIDTTHNKVLSETIEQSWERGRLGWVIDDTKSAPADDHPW